MDRSETSQKQVRNTSQTIQKQPDSCQTDLGPTECTGQKQVRNMSETRQKQVINSKILARQTLGPHRFLNLQIVRVVVDGSDTSQKQLRNTSQTGQKQPDSCQTDLEPTSLSKPTNSTSNNAQVRNRSETARSSWAGSYKTHRILRKTLSEEVLGPEATRIMTHHTSHIIHLTTLLTSHITTSLVTSHHITHITHIEKYLNSTEKIHRRS